VNPGEMRSPIRTRVYHSENPAEMPAPDHAAGRMLDYLAERESWNEALVDLTKR